VRLGAGRLALADPDAAEPTPNHRQPEEAAGRLGEDGEEQEQARHAQDQGRHGPFQEGIETDDVNIDEAIDRTEPAEADGEPAFVTGRDSTDRSWATDRARRGARTRSRRWIDRTSR
jgi:hypothetical protein